MSARQGSAAFTIVIGGVTAFVVGAFLLTFAVYPIATQFMDAAFWTASTPSQEFLTTYVGGIWKFWGAILLIAILSFVWVSTRR
ncbi:MAG: hypothetical protein ACOCQY_02750 [Halorhabdus sp.]